MASSRVIGHFALHRALAPSNCLHFCPLDPRARETADGVPSCRKVRELGYFHDMARGRESRAVNPEVAGSNPVEPASFPHSYGEAITPPPRDCAGFV